MILNTATCETLGQFGPGDQLEITGFRVEEGMREFMHRLFEVGFLVGEKLEVLSQAPFSRDPMSVKVKGATYALRRCEANLIQVRKISFKQSVEGQ